MSMAFALAMALEGCVHTPPDKWPASEPSAASTPPPLSKRPPKIGLALGGGAARGFAHVGVIQVLEEAGLRPSQVAGTSAGSLVAAIYASGKTGAQLQQVAETMEEVTIADWTLPIFSRGMFRGEALARYVNNVVDGKLIETFPMPLGIVATDLNSGQAVLFQRGDTGTAVRASSAVPAVFLPVKIGGREYVDGGLVAPVPVRFARQMGAELVIAWIFPARLKPTRPMTRCRSCCKPLPSWARASTVLSCKGPTWWCARRSPACQAPISPPGGARLKLVARRCCNCCRS